VWIRPAGQAHHHRFPVPGGSQGAHQSVEVDRVENDIDPDLSEGVDHEVTGRFSLVVTGVGCQKELDLDTAIIYEFSFGVPREAGFFEYRP